MSLLLSAVMTMMVATASDAKTVELTAHRGESADAPENTLASFNLAWSRGVKSAELDVHMSKDGKLVVSHDADTKRTTGVAKKIKDSAWDELRDLDAGKWKGEKWAGERLPLLGEMLETIPDDARCFIEVKTGPEIMPALIKAIRESGKKPEQLVIISFNAEAMAEAKRQLPELKGYYLASFKQDKETKEFSPTVDELIAKAKELRVDGLDLSYNGPIDAEFVRKVKDAGLELYVWTVDDAETARRLVEAGVDGITTNKAEWLEQQLQAGQ